MKKFNEWLSLREADSFTPPNVGSGYEALQQFWQQHQGSIVQFKGEGGMMMRGRLIDFLDEGVFVVQGEDGQEHDVSPEQLVGVGQSAPTGQAKITPLAK